MTQDPTTTVTGGAQQATAREFLAVVFRRKWLIIGLFLVTTGTVATISLTTPLVYQSTGRVLIKRGEKESALYPSRQIFNQWEEELASEMEIIKSQPVTDRAIELLGAQPGPRIAFKSKQIDCEVLGKSNVMAIAYVDPDPGVARRGAQAAIDAYVEFRQKNMMLSNPKGFFDSEIGSVDAELRRLTELRRSYSSREGIIDLEDQKRTQLSLLETLVQRRSETAAQLAEEESQQRVMRDLQARSDMDDPTVGSGPAGQDPILEVKRLLVAQRARVASLRERYREDAVEVANAESTLVTLQSMLKREVDAKLQVFQSHITALTERLRSMDQDIAVVRSDLESMPEKDAQISELDRQIGALKRRYDDLMDKSGDAKITEFTSQPLKVMLLSPAGPATPKVSRDYVRLALAPAFSIVVGIGVAFFIDGLDLTVRTAGHAEEVVELPVLATVNERRRRGA